MPSRPSIIKIHKEANRSILNTSPSKVMHQFSRQSRFASLPQILHPMYHPPSTLSNRGSSFAIDKKLKEKPYLYQNLAKIILLHLINTPTNQLLVCKSGRDYR